MAESKHTPLARRRRYLPPFLMTLLWVVPSLAVCGLAGFLLAQRLAVPKLLDKPEEMKSHDIKPTRILSPQEQASITQDQTSPVWTEGVRKSDIPKVDTDGDRSYDSGTAQKRRPASSGKPTKTTGHDKAAANAADAATDAVGADDGGDAPVDSPAIDEGPKALKTTPDAGGNGPSGH